MHQLMFIHGGDALNPGETFAERWHDWPIDDPFAVGEKKKKWKDDVVEKLGSAWACASPRFPNDMDAHYDQWELWFEKCVPFMKDGIVLVGHSLGGVFLAKYLTENTLPVQIAQLHFIAPCKSEGDFIVPNDLSNVPRQVARIHIYHSTDDVIVPFSSGEWYAAQWPEAEFVRFTDRNHFFAQEEFPELIERIVQK